MNTCRPTLLGHLALRSMPLGALVKAADSEILGNGKAGIQWRTYRGLMGAVRAGEIVSIA